MDKFLTTKELADLLRLKERKVYDLAAAGEIPCTRATGKLLFPREEIDSWLAQHTELGDVPQRASRPGVVLGSHDPLLEWALRESRSGLASYLDSSRDGLDRFAASEGIATGLHILDPQTGDWNEPAVRESFSREPVVLVEWAKRQRGLIVASGNPLKIKSLGDLRQRIVAPRQATSGSQMLLEDLLVEAGIAADEIKLIPPARSETDAALAVQEAKADSAFGLCALASQFRLDFIPLVTERFDLLIDRRSYFEPPLQALFAVTRSSAFGSKAADIPGYDISALGTVHFNGG
ncbi:MAG: helix-turn-helix transcriptional regulator [Alphaproteobacteria bacterium]|nr:helix-turn-helix transcriptional regulator [Alphaproteobacteria bacterium]